MSLFLYGGGAHVDGRGGIGVALLAYRFVPSLEEAVAAQGEGGVLKGCGHGDDVLEALEALLHRLLFPLGFDGVGRGVGVAALVGIVALLVAVALLLLVGVLALLLLLGAAVPFQRVVGEFELSVEHAPHSGDGVEHDVVALSIDLNRRCAAIAVGNRQEAVDAQAVLRVVGHPHIGAVSSFLDDVAVVGGDLAERGGAAVAGDARGDVLGIAPSAFAIDHPVHVTGGGGVVGHAHALGVVEHVDGIEAGVGGRFYGDYVVAGAVECQLSGGHAHACNEQAQQQNISFHAGHS